jgi:hypothetical protein
MGGNYREIYCGNEIKDSPQRHREQGRFMKKTFKRDDSFFIGRSILFDETTNSGFDPTCFMGRKKLTKSQREKCLADLGSGSETEYRSVNSLYEFQDKSPRFLDWLIECCETEGTYLNSGLCWALLSFQDDERVLPAIIKSVSKCPDEDIGNYSGLLGILGGKEAKEVLKERFNRLKVNPQAFTKQTDWNDLGFSLLHLCEVLMEQEPDNLEVAECLCKLSNHPNSFNKEIALNRVVGFFKNFYIFKFGKVRVVFTKALDSISKTNNPRLFGILLPYLFQTKPELTYEKFKKLYLKTKKEDRFNHLASSLLYAVERPLFWIVKLARELPYEDSEYFRGYLVWNQVKPISNEELVSVIKEDFASESPNTRVSAIEKLKNIRSDDAQKILKEALIDEPDEFIRKQFEKHLTKLKKFSG